MGKEKERMRKRMRKTKVKKEEKERGKNEGKRVGERKWKRGIMNGKNAKIIFQEEKKNKVYQKYGKSEAFQTEDSQVLFHFGGSCEIGDFLFVSAFEFTGKSELSNFDLELYLLILTPSSGETEYSETPPLIFGNLALPEPEIHTSIFVRTNTWLLGFRFDGTLDGSGWFQTCT
ncbi:unnamed protein product [Rhizophagus irregularis]|nr:unnamed protein product [Rhizophagus irregularis]